LAHIGVLDELSVRGYRVAAVAGTSIGGLMGALFAIGMAPRDMARWTEEAFQEGIFHFRPSAGGLLSIDRIRNHLETVLADKTFEDAQLPLALTAVDLEEGEEVILTSGRLIEAVLATIALPGVFPPFQRGAARLVDGGVVDPVPVGPLRSIYHGPIIAVPLGARPGAPASPASHLANLPLGGLLSHLSIGEALEVISRSLEISSRLFSDLRLQLDHPDVVVRPEVADIGILDSPEAGPVIEAGRKAMVAALPALERSSGVRGALRRVFGR
jgi:NTE family protein